MSNSYIKKYSYQQPTHAGANLGFSKAYFPATFFYLKKSIGKKNFDKEMLGCFDSNGWVDVSKYISLRKKRYKDIETVSYMTDFFKEMYSLGYAYRLLENPPYSATVFYAATLKVFNTTKFIPQYRKWKKWKSILTQWETVENGRYKKEFEKWIEE